MNFIVAAISTRLCTLLLGESATQERKRRRQRRLAAVLLVPVCACALASPLAFNIPAQPLDGALTAFAVQSKMQLLYEADAVSAHTSRPVIGEFDRRAALEMLLEDTGLEAVFSRGDAATIRARVPLVRASYETALPDAKADDSQPLHQAQATSAASPPRSDNSSSTLEEVVVTAQKKAENLQDVPVPVSVVSASTLVATNKTKLREYFSEIPGLSYTDDGGGLSLVSIRGLTAGSNTNPTVGITVDDVPFGAPTSNGGGNSVPEIDPGDLVRVEVLRGPQGTLYGASSLGGLIKFVTADPDMGGGMHGQAQVGTSRIANASGSGYNVNAAINVPVLDTLAVRVSGFTHQDPGYIDNVALGLRGLNEARTSGVHLAALWAPSDSFSLKLSALYQSGSRDGGDYVEVLPGLGSLQQADVRGAGQADSKLQAYSATLHARLGTAQITSITGYTLTQRQGGSDWSYALGFLSNLTQDTFGIPNGTTGTVLDSTADLRKLSEELRLSMPLGQRLELLLGLFYTHDYGYQTLDYRAVDPVTGQVAANWIQTLYHVPDVETAAFANFTVHVTKRFDVQIGGRGSVINQSFDEVDTGPLAPIFYFMPSPLVYPHSSTRARPFTYLLTPQFRFSDDLMAYTRVTSGYRPGGPNGGALVFGLPAAYSPDKTQNYELGIKGDVLNRRLSFDASVYYIDWKNVQTVFVDPTFMIPFTANGARAKSQGVELAAQALPAAGLTLGGWVSFNDAQLTQPLPANANAYGASGDRLPFTSRFSGSLKADQEFPLGAKLTGFVGGSVTYVGARLGNFSPPDALNPAAAPARQRFPGYATADVRGGVRLESWTLSFYANNLTDRRAQIFGGIASGNNPFAFTDIRPRTLGLNISESF